MALRSNPRPADTQRARENRWGWHVTTTVPGRRPRTADLLATSLRLLAAHGDSAIPDVLGLTASALGFDDLVLRNAAAATVIARATPPAVPEQRDPSYPWVLDAAVRADDRVLGVLTATAATPFTADRAAALTAVADAVALALALAATGRRTTERRRAAGQAVLDAEADRALAAGLHQELEDALVAVRYSAALAATGRIDPADVEEPARAALAAFRHGRRDLRAHALEAGLRAALIGFADRRGGDRPDDGEPILRVSVRAADPSLDEVPPPIAVTVQRVAEAALRGATGHAVVSAAVEQAGVKLRVDSADIACDASELDRWERRVHALGGTLRLQAAGVELTLPAATEGSYDDGPDL